MPFRISDFFFGVGNGFSSDLGTELETTIGTGFGSSATFGDSLLGSMTEGVNVAVLYARSKHNASGSNTVISKTINHRTVVFKSK